MDVPDVQPEAGLELLTAQRKLELIETKLTWPEAEAHCVSRGGHLASITSPGEWKRLETLILDQKGKNAIVWVGFTDKENEGEWIATDGSKLSRDLWNITLLHTDGSAFENCLAVVTGRLGKGSLRDARCNDAVNGMRGLRAYPVCSEPKRMLIQNDTQLIFTSENISAPSLQFKWTMKPADTLQSSNMSVGGFTIQWHIEGNKAQNQSKDNYNERFWMPTDNSRFESEIMRTVMNLVRESKVKNVSEDMVWKALLKYRWNTEMIGKSTCLEESQELEVITKAAQELKLATGYDSWVPQQDLAFGFQLYSTVHYCPSTPAEAAKLSLFFGNLLTSPSHNLKEVVSATLQNMQPKAGSILEDFSAMNKWYHQLERRYNFSSLGHIVNALSSEEQLERLRKLNSPFGKEINNTEGLRLKGRLYEPDLI